MSAERIGEDLDRAQARLQAATISRSYLTVQEVAELARCEHKAVRHAVHDGSLPAFRAAARILVREADAIAWIESRPARQPASAPAPARPKRRRAASGSVRAIREMEREADPRGVR